MVDASPVTAPAATTRAARAAVRALAVAPTDGPTAAADVLELLAMQAELSAALGDRLAIIDRTETWQADGSRAQWSWLARHALTPAEDPDRGSPVDAGLHPVTSAAASDTDTDVDDPDPDGPSRSGPGPRGGRPAPMSAGAARGWVRLSQDLSRFGHVAEELRTGRLSRSHADVACAALRQLATLVAGTDWDTPAWHDAQEQAVVAAALLSDPITLQRELSRRLQALLPEPAAADAQRRRDQRSVKLTVGFDGMWNLTGLLDPDSGQLLHAALQAFRRGDHTAGDLRTPGMRDCDALIALAGDWLDRGTTTERGVSPHLLVLVPEARLAAHDSDCEGRGGGDLPPDPFTMPLFTRDGQLLPTADADAVLDRDGPLGLGEPVPPARYPDGTPVPETTLSRMLCNGRLTRLVLDAQSRPMDVGRTTRIFTHPQWVAAMTTFGWQCATDGCHAPPGRLELHHARWWRDGGTSDLDNCIPLCHGTASCHTRVHDGHTLHLRDGRTLDRHGLHDITQRAHTQAQAQQPDATPAAPVTPARPAPRVPAAELRRAPQHLQPPPLHHHPPATVDLQWRPPLYRELVFLIAA